MFCFELIVSNVFVATVHWCLHVTESRMWIDVSCVAGKSKIPYDFWKK